MIARAAAAYRSLAPHKACTSSRAPPPLVPRCRASQDELHRHQDGRSRKARGRGRRRRRGRHARRRRARRAHAPRRARKGRRGRRVRPRLPRRDQPRGRGARPTQDRLAPPPAHDDAVLCPVYRQDDARQLVHPWHQDGQPPDERAVQLARDHLLPRLPHLRVAADARPAALPAGQVHGRQHCLLGRRPLLPRRLPQLCRPLHLPPPPRRLRGLHHRRLPHRHQHVLHAHRGHAPRRLLVPNERHGSNPLWPGRVWRLPPAVELARAVARLHAHLGRRHARGRRALLVLHPGLADEGLLPDRRREDDCDRAAAEPEHGYREQDVEEGPVYRGAHRLEAVGVCRLCRHRQPAQLAHQPVVAHHPELWVHDEPDDAARHGLWRDRDHHHLLVDAHHQKGAKLASHRRRLLLHPQHCLGHHDGLAPVEQQGRAAHRRLPGRVRDAGLCARALVVRGDQHGPHKEDDDQRDAAHRLLPRQPARAADVGGKVRAPLLRPLGRHPRQLRRVPAHPPRHRLRPLAREQAPRQARRRRRAPGRKVFRRERRRDRPDVLGHYRPQESRLPLPTLRRPSHRRGAHRMTSF